VKEMRDMKMIPANNSLIMSFRPRQECGYGGILRYMRYMGAGLMTLLVLFPALGHGVNTPILSLADIELVVREHNPAVLAAIARARSADGMALASAAWPAPGLGVTREDFPRPGFALNESERKSLVVSQEIPFPGKTFLAWRTSSAQAEKMEAEAQMVLQEQLFMARQMYWDLVVATESEKYYSRASEVMGQLVTLSQKRTQFGMAGRMEQLMAPMARMEQAELEISRLDLGQERLEAQASINEVMGDAPAKELVVSAPAEAPGDPGLEDAAWLETGISESPAVAVVLKDLKIMQARRTQARAEWLPDFMLEYSAVDMKDGTKSGMAMARISVPFVWFWKAAGENRSASEEVRASGADLDQARLEVRRLALIEIARLGLTRKQAEIFRNDALPQADRALDLAVSGYQSGSIGPADALTAVRSWLSINLEKTMLTAQVGRSNAVLSRLRGK